jgi:hypothetical protein
METTIPGVFAAGETRHGSIKRIAAGVGGRIYSYSVDTSISDKYLTWSYIFWLLHFLIY